MLLCIVFSGKQKCRWQCKSYVYRGTDFTECDSQMSYRYPPGWFPPYHGAAPPMPPDLSFNRQQWQKGSWQFNPTYNWQRYSVPQMQWSWIHPSHRPPQPFPANFNPYKKAIKPPSAEYLAMKVSDNGLDLHNMVPACVCLCCYFSVFY